MFSAFVFTKKSTGPCGTFLIKFIYSEKATKFFEIFTILLSYVVPVKSKVKISKNVMAFSEYINFMTTDLKQLTSGWGMGFNLIF